MCTRVLVFAGADAGVARAALWVRVETEKREQLPQEEQRLIVPRKQLRMAGWLVSAAARVPPSLCVDQWS